MRASHFSIALPMVVLLLSGCAAGEVGTGPHPPSSPVPSATARQPATITIKNFGFPGPPTVSAGSTVTVSNLDAQAHTVTSDDGSSFDVEIAGGGTATFTAPARPGTYAYHCAFHPNMHGTLVVR
jgi:plastocyanin